MPSPLRPKTPQLKYAASGQRIPNDEKGAVSRRYRRQAEAGAYCITVDGESLTDKTVTLRDRDTLEHVRVEIDEVDQVIRERLNA